MFTIDKNRTEKDQIELICRKAEELSTLIVKSCEPADDSDEEFRNTVRKLSNYLYLAVMKTSGLVVESVMPNNPDLKSHVLKMAIDSLVDYSKSDKPAEYIEIKVPK